MRRRAGDEVLQTKKSLESVGKRTFERDAWSQGLRVSFLKVPMLVVPTGIRDFFSRELLVYSRLNGNLQKTKQNIVKMLFCQWLATTTHAIFIPKYNNFYLILGIFYE